LVVIVVISILAGITFPLSRYAIRRANEARQTVMRAKIHSALEDYRAVYGEYPITPPAPSADVLRHYPAVYDTHDKISSSTNVNFGGTNLTETIYDVNETALPAIDYSLTYPLMLKQLEKGARPFMEFPIVDVVFLVVEGGAENEIQWSVWRRMKGGGKMSVLLTGIYGDAVQRPKAIDPVSGSNWVYVCTNGLNYKLTP
jgi:type II secretory pathway pseudopilin PulG